MPILVTNNSSVTSQRVIPLWCVGSNGTTPATAEAGGQPTWMLGGVYYGATANTLSAWSANAGEYFLVLAKSETSVVGQGVVRYSSGNALETATPFEILAVDSFDSVRAGLTALPNAAAAAAGGLPTFGTGTGQINPSSGSVGLIVQTYSGVTIDGVNRVNSSVTMANALYSAVTVRVDPQAYSGLTIDGVNRVNSNVTPASGLYSALTVRVDPTQSFSGVTVGVSNIAPASYSGVSVEVFNISTAVGQTNADRILARSLAGGADGPRTVQDALRSLRNRVLINGSMMTVYTEDDATSAWTASVTTTTDTSVIAGVDPTGP